MTINRFTDRRRLLVGATALAATAAIGLPRRRARAAGPLKVGTYGGYFKDSFDVNRRATLTP